MSNLVALIILITFFGVYFLWNYTISNGIIRRKLPKSDFKKSEKLENSKGKSSNKTLNKYQKVLPFIPNIFLKKIKFFGSFANLFFGILAIILSFCLINVNFPLAGIFLAVSFVTISIFVQIWYFQKNYAKINADLNSKNSESHSESHSGIQSKNQSENQLQNKTLFNFLSISPFNSLFSSAIWAISAFFFGLLYLVRDTNPLLAFFNFLGLIYSFAFLVQTQKSSWKWTFEYIISAPFLIIPDILNTPNLFKLAKIRNEKLEAEKFEMENLKNNLKISKIDQNSPGFKVELTENPTENLVKSNSKTQFQKLQLSFWGEKQKNLVKKFGEISLGLFLGFLLLLIIVPILASTNPIFANFILSFWNFLVNFLQLFNLIPFLEFLAEFLNSFIFGLSFWRLIFGYLFWLSLPRLFASILADSVWKINLEIQANSEEKSNSNSQKSTENTSQISKNSNSTSNSNSILLIPKFGIIVVLVVYLISQVNLYFASPSELSALGYTFGKLNNEVFGQLSIVCLIVFGLVFFDRIKQFLHEITSGTLLFQSSFLAFIATKSVWDYIANFGLTFKRLYGVVVVIFIFGTIGILSFQLFRKLANTWVFQKIVYLSFILLILVNLANFDSLIYQNSPLFDDLTYYKSPLKNSQNNFQNSLQTNSKLSANSPENSKIDYRYLTELSLDSGHFDQILNKIVELRRNYIITNPTKFSGKVKDYIDQSGQIQTHQDKKFNSKSECQIEAINCYPIRSYDKDSFEFETRDILEKAIFLQQKYRVFGISDWATFNLTEWQTFGKIQNIKLYELRRELLEIEY